MTLASGSRLGPYEILAPLGAGGMGEVYRARDPRLGRDVAVKVLPASFSQDGDRLRRFEQEARAASALNHPNILTVHDLGSQDGSPYVVSELLEGETLRAAVAGGKLPPRRATDYGLQIAHGLAAAHEKGIVHRDLKPENLFVTKDGRIKILDFGLAKLIGADTSPGEETSAPTATLGTEPGIVMGTVGYMSPEQVRGKPADARSDIFSFGAIIYEMLSGGRAFRGDSAAETMSAILKEYPPELSIANQNVSPALDRIVHHCLEKSPDRRFQSAQDIAFALSEASGPAATSGARLVTPMTGKARVLLTVAAILVLAVVSIFLLRRTHGAGAEARDVQRLAVLPFENLGAPEDDYFADGIADAVRGKLTALPGLQVIARGSSTPYKKTTKTPKQIAEELNTSYLLTATVRWQKSGGTSRVEVTPELVDVTRPDAPTSRWQQPFDAALTDVFQVQSDIAERVAQALGIALGTGEGNRFSEKSTRNLAAYDAFLKGEEASDSLETDDPPSLRRALGYYEQAVALDPGFAAGWARVSVANSVLYLYSVPRPEVAERAKQTAEKAVALAPDRPDGYIARGAYHSIVLSDLNRALEHFTRARRLAPGNSDALRGMGAQEMGLGRWESAIEHFEQAERLDPRRVLIHNRLGSALLCLRRYPEARAAFDRGLALAPGNLALIARKATTFLDQGDLAGARAVLEAAARKNVEQTALVAYFDRGGVWILSDEQRELLLRLTPGAFDNDKGTWGLALTQAFALKGDAANVRIYAEQAREAFEEQLRATPDDADRHTLRGLALAYLGRKDEAIREGKRGVALEVSKIPAGGPWYWEQLARIYVLVGEPDKALDQLARLLKTPGGLSPGYLEIDPNFDPLRKNPRFQKLVAEVK